MCLKQIILFSPDIFVTQKEELGNIIISANNVNIKKRETFSTDND